MKRMTIFVTALALALGLTQCKKDQPATTETQGVTITLNVDGASTPSTGSGTNGSKVNVDPYANEQVTFEDGDQILVASGGQYIGTLIRTDGLFTGEVTNPVEGEKLFFYFLGNKQGTLEAGATTCTVNISDQTEELPVISMGKSTVVYSSDNSSYSSRLYNKASLMKFNVATVSDEAICITGMNNTVTVNFGEPTEENCGFTYSMDAEDGGLIKMAGQQGSGEKTYWAIVLQQAALEAGEEGSAYSSDNSYIGIRPAIHAIEVNKYYHEGEDVITMEVTLPTGAIKGLFSVSATRQVWFSQGNLQYIGSAATPYWKFADNQWDYFGATTGQNSNSETVDRDLFGWGTSGYNHGATAYQPWATSKTKTQYYAYGDQSYNLNDQTGQADWGYNAISNGGNQENSGWHTLTTSEWAYMYGSRTGAASKKGHGNVNGVNGIILIPDEWILPDGLTFTAGNSSWANVYSSDQWAQMEANGAVFLPAAGFRSGTSLSYVGSQGYYWESTQSNSYAYYVSFFSGNFGVTATHHRYSGLSVRLVRYAN